VQLVVENEKIRRAERWLRQQRLDQLNRIDVEEAAEDFVHRQETRSHAAAGREKLPPAESELLAVDVGQFLDSMFHLLLLFRLRVGHVLAVRYHLCRYRRVQLIGLVRRASAARAALR
jgi:hypothetical protein